MISQSKTYQHIIWDWNGTLLDDAWLCVEIMNAQLEKHGLPQISPGQYADLFRFPVKDYYADLGFDFEQTPFEGVSDEFIAEYERRKLECPVRPEGLELLNKITQNGGGQSIISASKQDSLNEITQHYQVYDLFMSVRGLDNHHAAGKLDIGRAWMKELGLPPDQVLMIGDTLHDHHLAQDLGIDCILLTSGHQSRARLEESGVKIVESLGELGL